VAHTRLTPPQHSFLLTVAHSEGSELSEVIALLRLAGAEVDHGTAFTMIMRESADHCAFQGRRDWRVET